MKNKEPLKVIIRAITHVVMHVIAITIVMLGFISFVTAGNVLLSILTGIWEAAMIVSFILIFV